MRFNFILLKLIYQISFRIFCIHPKINFAEMIDYIEGLNLYKIGNLIPKIEII